jgi:hypothetical protein
VGFVYFSTENPDIEKLKKNLLSRHNLLNVVFVYFNCKPRYGKVLKNQQVGTNLSSASTGKNIILTHHANSNRIWCFLTLPIFRQGL